MRPVQAWARTNRIRYFLPRIQPGSRVLEVGPGEGWFRKATEAAVEVDYVTIDVEAAADIQGNILDWRKFGMQPGSFDVIVAFEVVEHTACFDECHELLKPGGLLLVTTPMPHADWILKILEALRLTQKRTSPHTNLVYLKATPKFACEAMRRPFGLGQWAVFRKV